MLKEKEIASKEQNPGASQTKWTADPTHSEITFKVRHMMITHVTGILSDCTIEAFSAEQFENGKVLFTGKSHLM